MSILRMPSQQVIRCQKQHLERYINLRLTRGAAKVVTSARFVEDSAALHQMMIKGAIRALVILQIAVSWVKKKNLKKKTQHKRIVVVRLASSLHPSICALSRKKKERTWIIYAFRNISAPRTFLGRHASRFGYTFPDSFANKTGMTGLKMFIDRPKFEMLK